MDDVTRGPCTPEHLQHGRSQLLLGDRQLWRHQLADEVAADVLGLGSGLRHVGSILEADCCVNHRPEDRGRVPQLGYSVKNCKTGVEALVAAASEPFDLLVAAADLPDFPGLELGRLFREHRPALRVLFTTNGAAGPNVLPKPFTLQQLADDVERALQAAPQRAITAVFEALACKPDEN